MAMKRGGFKSPNGMQKPQLRPPGMGKSKPMVGSSASMAELPASKAMGFKKGGMASKKKGK